MARRVFTLVLAIALLVACAVGIRHYRSVRADAARRLSAARLLSSLPMADVHLERVDLAPAGRPAAPLAAPCGDATGTPCGSLSARGPFDHGFLEHFQARAPELRRLFGIENQRDHLLLILFSPTDCSLCLQESSVWVELARQSRADGNHRLQIIGIADRTTVDEARSASGQMGLGFPVYVDSASRIREALGVRDTPFKVLMDPGGDVRMMDGPHQDRAGHWEFARDVRRMLGMQAR